MEPPAQRFLASTAPFMVLSFLVLLLRLYTRLVVTKNPGCEDALIVIGWILILAAYIHVSLLTRNHGFGLHLATLTTAQFERLGDFIRSFFVAAILYSISIGLVKLSMLLQYVRLFVVGPTRLLSYITAFIVCANMIWNTFLMLFFCNPIRKFWRPFDVVGTCLPRAPVWHAISGANIASSVLIILVPIPAILQLHLATHTKVFLVCIFGAGILEVVIAVLRLLALNSIMHSIDAPFHFPDVALWSTLECAVGVICASAPAVWPFFSRVVPGLLPGLRRRCTTKCGGTQGSTGRWSVFLWKIENRRSGGEGASRLETEAGVEAFHLRRQVSGEASRHIMGEREGKIVVTQEIQQSWHVDKEDEHSYPASAERSQC